jgi:hypothetical protein
MPLNESLKENGVNVEDAEGVVTYLKENLKWRVVKVCDNVLSSRFGVRLLTFLGRNRIRRM